MNIRLILAALPLISLSACTTHLEVGPARADDPATRRGIAYFLPFTQFTVKTTWTVASCGSDGLEIVAQIEATPASVPDPEHLYTIDYSSLSAFTKTSSVKVDFYDSGAIKTINASADDRTGEVLTKAISAIGKVAAFAVGAGATESTKPSCSEPIKKLLETTIPSQKDEVVRLTGLLQRRTETLEALTIRVVRSGSATPERVFAEQDRRIADVVATKMELDAAKAKLAASRSAVSFSDERKFPSTSSEHGAIAIKLPNAVVKKWVGNLAALAGRGAAESATLSTLAGPQTVYLELLSAGNWAAGQNYPIAGRPLEESNRAGLRYRVAVPGTLSACMLNPCSTPSDAATQPIKVDDLPVRILQNGTTFYLPFKSAPFSNGSLTASFTETGILTSAGYEQKRAPAEVVANLGDLLADQVVTVGGKVREARTTDLEDLQDRLAIAKAQKELAAAQKALLDAPVDPLAAASAALTADTAAKNAELANLAADLAVRKARTEHAAAIAGQ